MTVFDWLGRSVSYIRSEGFREGVRLSANEFKKGVAYRLDQYVPGEPIFDREWDVLIILDACRPDLLSEFTTDYEFIPENPKTIRSKGSGSRTWMDRNFTEEWGSEMERTAYITGNPFSDEYTTADQFSYLDEVWRYAWDEDRGTIPARPVTDRSIDTARTMNPDRLLIHYMQPHFPSVPDPIGSEIDIRTFGKEWDSVWDDLETGEISVERAWEAYRANLEYVLDDVDLLLKNIDAETVVISADHGNAFGEFGFWGHPPHNPIPILRQVPWVETTARDTGTYEPRKYDREGDGSDEVVTSRLEDLGYL